MSRHPVAVRRTTLLQMLEPRRSWTPITISTDSSAAICARRAISGPLQLRAVVEQHARERLGGSATPQRRPGGLVEPDRIAGKPSFREHDNVGPVAVCIPDQMLGAVDAGGGI